MRLEKSAALTLAAAFIIGGPAAQAVPLDRPADPVVIEGGALAGLLGAPIGHIVAWRYQFGWTQIPVQIDERKVIDFGVVYNEPPVGVLTTAYADPNTYTGADDDPFFDANDELVFMARDAGTQAPLGAPLPAQLVPGSGLEIAITDSLDGARGYVYLFRSDGTLPPDAGQDYVGYDFVLTTGSGVYFDVYSLLAGPNPEDSAAYSAYYRTHFSDRWIRDQVDVYAGSSTGVDILDRHKNMFGPGDCARTENTFSAGEGAFFANIDGPVRAIRSYMGANSGPLTQREHLFYDKRQDVATFLRVHPISGVMDIYDYGPLASGMSYFNDLNTGGVLVDGVPDSIIAGPIQWEMVTGIQGSMVIALSLVTDIPFFAFTSYYSDDVTPAVTQCTGDAFEYATSGVWVNQPIPNTDPNLGSFNTLTTVRIVYYEPPGQTVPQAAWRSAQADTPLAATAQPYDPLAGDYDEDGNVDVEDFAGFQRCNGAIAPWPVGCGAFDFDNGGAIDLIDYAQLEAVMDGPL